MIITLKSGKQNKVHIMLDGEYAMTVDSDFVAFSGIKDKSEISDEELAELTGKVNSRRAFNKAAELLSMRDHSAKELLTKLRQKGFSEGAEQAVEKLKEYGYVDDRRFAQSYANELQRVKKYGKRRIESELFKKGIDRETIFEVTEELELDNSELVSIIERKYLRYLDSEKGVQKTVNALLRLGYSFGEIKEALNTVKESLDIQEDFQ